MNPKSAIISIHLEGKTCRVITMALKYFNVCKSAVHETIKWYKETGSSNDRPKSSLPRSMRTPRFIQVTRAKISLHFKRKMPQVANVSRETIYRLIREDLWMKTYRLEKWQLLGEATMIMMLTRAMVLLKFLNSCTDVSTIWTDDNIFMLEVAYNSHNDLVFVRSIEDIPFNECGVFLRQKPASGIVWTGVISCSI
ncbi:uncharacterized protein [Lepeophtheirus salmonis]|uniref:uncharacterized protein n=1 Tax=Lepeophtheirus salmonis TaxID=72036 RepID=UPI003AF3E411